MAIDFSQNPYYDDYDETKDYYRLLFRPSYAVQSRELTQLQTVLQNQINRHGSFVFKNGSIVTGGQVSLDVDAVYYLKLQATNLSGQTIVLENYVGKFIADTEDAGVRAYVIASDAGLDGNPPTLMIKYVSSVHFSDNQEFVTEDRIYTALTFVAACTGKGSICSINEGIYFINGVFARVGSQTVILERYTTTPSFRIGLEINEQITTENQDGSLLDPALESSNYLAPGAHRYQLHLILSKRSLESTDDSAFLELMRVENGQLLKKIKYPILSDIENTLARRTYDESGSYTVRSFQIALKDDPTSTDQYNIILEPGKAYVLGYEFETAIPTTLVADRARDTQTIYQYPIGIDYENYVEVTNMAGSLPLDTFAPVNVYCVPKANVSTTNLAAANAVCIGTVAIRSLDYVTGVTASNLSSGIWRAHIMSANIISQSDYCLGTGTVNTILLGPSASTSANSYDGVNLRIISHNGVPSGEVRRIKSYNGSVATMESNFAFGIPNSTTHYSLDFEFKDARSIIYNYVSGGNLPQLASMDIASTSKVQDAYGSTFITDTDYNRALFKFPNNYIVGNGQAITNSEFYGYKVYTGQFSANLFSFSTTTGIVSAASTGSPISSESALENFFVVVRSSGGPGFANNQIINFSYGTSNTISVTTSGNTSSFTITAPGAFNQYVTVYAKVKVPYAHTTPGIRKIKRQKLANITSVYTGSANVAVSSGITWYKQDGYGSNSGAQLILTGAAVNNLRVPNRAQSLYTADVIALKGVYDFGTLIPSTANLALAVDLTENYKLDDGQRDNMYDHASISLLPNAVGTKGNTVIFIDYYEHVGSGYLTADSYIDGGIAYQNIPVYVSKQLNVLYPLGDCIDFRPRRQNGDVIGVYEGILFPVSGTLFETDFSYYLPRIDKVILTKDRTFEVVEGIPSLTPVPPADKPNSMTLYQLTLPPYTGKISNIGIKYIDNRRYTMRDIGTLEQRISHLEYYTSLNMLELAAKSQEIVDEQTGLNRVKNGIIVDPFRGHNLGDVTRPDYLCSIDPMAGELRPAFYPNHFSLMFDPVASTNYQKNGLMLSLPYSDVTFIDQPLAALAINVNPFNVVKFIGKVSLDPSSDVWVDVDQKPDVLVNLDGGSDGWMALASLIAPPQKISLVPPGWQFSNSAINIAGDKSWLPSNNPSPVKGIGATTGYDRNYIYNYAIQANTVVGQITGNNLYPDSIVFGTTWNSWQTNWTGITSTTSINDPGYSGWQGGNPLHTGVVPAYADIVKTTITDSTQQQTRTGSRTIFTTDLISKSIGNLVVDTSIVPYIRSRGVLFRGKGFLPNTPLYAFFDGVAVQSYINRANIIEVASNNVTYMDSYQDNELLRVYEPATSTNLAFAIASISRNKAETTNVAVISVTSSADQSFTILPRVMSANATFLIGEKSGSNTQILRYHHYSGAVRSASANSVILDSHMKLAQTNNLDLVGQKIYFTTGNGFGETRTITSYNPLSLTAVLDTPLSVSTGANTTFYSIGDLMSDEKGECTGVFGIPSTDSVRFRTGERVFRLIDNFSNNLDISQTNGDATYYAQGLLETKENTILSTRVPVIERETVTQDRTVIEHKVTNTVVGEKVIGYWDPLAETFLVDQTQHPNGVQITGVRLCFKSKDEVIPINVQIRPVVNGYPHSSQVLPFANIMVNPEKIKVASESAMMEKYLNPDSGSPLDDPSLYTEIKFDAPVTLQPGFEYAIVLIANTIKYEVYISQMGQNLLGTDRLISTQPYLGSLFKSQNSSTWTAEQNQDLMFRLLRASYDTSAPLVANFMLETAYTPSANVPFDVFYLTKHNLVVPNTSINMQFQATLETGELDSFRPFEFDNNVVFDDNLGRRIITSDPRSFSVKMFLSSQIKDISPMIDVERLSLLCIQNFVNNLPITTGSIVVTNTNSQFTNTANIVVALSGGGGTGAKAEAVVSNNAISGLVVTNEGYGYTSSPTITITGGSPLANATAIVVGEDQPTGGPALTRYITRKVALADGFDAGDLRVYLTAYKPLDAEIYVYYKVLSTDDPDSFDNKPYQLMTVISGYNGVSSNYNDLKEYTYAPGVNYTPDNRVTYPGFGTFRYFAIKIVMASTNPTHPPRVKNFRAVALPALTPA